MADEKKDDEDDLYLNRQGEEVPYEELTEAEESFYDSGGHGQEMDLNEYVDNCREENSGLSIDEEGNCVED
jgi:hypothetical protein